MASVALLLALMAVVGASALAPAGLSTSRAPWASRGQARGPGGRSFERQRVDHFDPARAMDHWSQRFFVNDTFFDRGTPGRPVFLCVGGEGPAFTPQVAVTGTVHCAWMEHLAQVHRGLVLVLEHRFYGYSLPVDDLSTDNLALLSHRQALADVARFVQFAQEEFQLTPENKFVTFGGSYPGMMAGWARATYPALIHASVASSAPVQAVVDNAGYNAVVGEALATELVGGSQACLRAVQDAFQELGARLAQDATQVGDDIGVCNAAQTLADQKNVSQLVDDLTLLFPAQSNDPLCTDPLCNIEKICAHMTAPAVAVARRSLRASTDTSYDRLVSLARSQLAASSCLEVNYLGAVSDLANPSPALPLSGDRSWTWQTCSEFGFYQTCEGGCPFASDALPWYGGVKPSLDLCDALFGIKPEDVYANVNATNLLTGGRAIRATRIGFPNGGVDPWKAQGVLTSPDPENEPALLVPGASHHAWTHPVRAGDSKELVKARATIAAWVDGWLKEE